MNDAHLHLVVNHLPIIFPLLALIILVIGMISKSEAVKRIAFLIFIMGAITSIIAMNTGEGAEDFIEKLSPGTKKLIHTHEEAAEVFAILTYILGGISLLGVWASFNIKKYSNIISILAVIFSLVVLFFAQQTGTTGGEIRHTEIRNDLNLNSSELELLKDDNHD